MKKKEKQRSIVLLTPLEQVQPKDIKSSGLIFLDEDLDKMLDDFDTKEGLEYGKR